MKFIIDIILALIILVSAFIGYKKGFIKLFLPVITFALAIYLSFMFSPKVSNFVSQKYIEPKIVSVVEVKINGVAEDGKNKANGILSFVAKKTGLDIDAALENMNYNKEAAQTFTHNNVMPVLNKPIQSVVSLVLFLLLSIVLCILARMVNKIIKGSPLGLINQLGGVCVGAAGGIVLTVILCVVFYLILNFNENGFLIFTKDNLKTSYLYNYVIGFLFK